MIANYLMNRRKQIAACAELRFLRSARHLPFYCRLSVTLFLCLFASVSVAFGQMSADEHASHHPDAKTAAPAAKSPVGTGAKPDAMSGMGGAPAAPASDSKKNSGMGGAGGMGAMMKGMMGAPPQKELYPSLMALPILSPEQRLQLQQQAEARVKIGAALLQQGAARMANPAANDTELQEGAADARAGLREMESGQAAQRALADGLAPQPVALQWFQTEMNIAPPAPQEESRAFLGVTPFHLFTMALLVGFALVMVAMYFFKMRRAAALFGRLDADSGSPPGAAPPLDGTSGPSSSGDPPDEKTPPPDGTPLPPKGASAIPVPSVNTANTADNPPAAPAVGGAAGDAVTLPYRIDEPVTAPMTANWRGQLRVGSIITETPNVKTFRLRPTSKAHFLPFIFVPGQFLNVAFAIGGARMNRSYSISSSPNEREYVDLTIRREPRGAISRHMDDLLKVGDQIETGGPVGKFTFNGTEADSIVLISGGVGITPMMSITRYLTEIAWPGDIFFIYSCRTPADFIFADELAALQRRNPKLRVAVTISKPEGTDWKGARGRISKEWLTQTVPDLASRRTHLCGPPSLMDAIKAIFTELGIPPDHLKTEAFGAVKPAPATPGVAKPTGPATGPLVTFSKNSKSAKIHTDLQTGDSPPQQTILELSEELSIGIEFSCRVGTCGVCKTKMTAGKVDQEIQDALDDNDKANGIILACQAKPTSDVTVEA